MLNLAPIFRFATDSMREFGEHLNVPPLPTTVFLMQRDVINHYRYASTHYFPISLSETYLQNSSIGTPYEKWAKFTNDDFDLLDFACLNLMRYTSRLIYSTAYNGLVDSGRARETRERCDLLTSPICDYKYNNKRIGIQINDNQTMTIFRFNDEIETETEPIANRAILASYRDQCMYEVAELEKLNQEFAKLCDDKSCIFFDALNESFWV